MTEAEVPAPVKEPENIPPPVVGPEIVDLSTSSLLTISQTEVSLNDPLFPFSQSFCAKTRKEKEMLFMKAFEEQVSFIRTKELRADNSLGKPLSSQENLNSMSTNRSKFLEQNSTKNTKKILTQKNTIFSSNPAPRVNTTKTPTFDPLLNVNYESQYSIMDKFKETISEILIQNRAKVRSKKVLQKLMASQGQPQAVVQQNEASSSNKLTAESLLTLDIKCTKGTLKFTTPLEPEVPPAPTAMLEPNKIEKSVQIYKPGLVERFQLTAFPRTETDAFTPIIVIPPTVFPTVPEEQPVRERKEPILPEDSIVNPLQNHDISSTIPLPTNYGYPRDVRFFEFDPTFSLRAIPAELPPLPNQIGQASILALPLTDYEEMFIGSKCKTDVAPFTFTGIPKPRLPQMSGPDPVDMRELEADDDIDNLEVHPKSRPVSDYISKPIDSTNKSHEIAKQVIQSQGNWKTRQVEGAKKLCEKLVGVNKLMIDKTLEIPISDLTRYIEN